MPRWPSSRTSSGASTEIGHGTPDLVREDAGLTTALPI